MDAIDHYLAALQQAARAEAQIAQAARRVRLSSVKAVSLGLIARSGPLPAAYLGYVLSVHPKTITDALRSLQQLGFVAATDASGAPRGDTVTLTPRGAALATTFLVALDEPATAT